MGGWWWVAGSSGNKAISAFNYIEVEVEAELGNYGHVSLLHFIFFYFILIGHYHFVSTN